MTPFSTTPHIPAMGGAPSARTTWQMLVPMIATSVPGRVTVAAGTDTWASTLATATAMPAGSPVHPAARSLRPPARVPIDVTVRDSLSSTTVPKPGSSASKKAASGKPSAADHSAL